MAIEARLAERLGLEVQTIWSDDGIAIRLPEGDAPLDGIEALLFPEADEIEDLVVEQVASSSLFASRFRENAARALLLLPTTPPGRGPRSGSSASGRPTCWRSRRATAVFPILVETYRECLSDVFDLPALREVLAGVASPRDRGPQRRDASGPARSRAACCSTTSPRTCTTATRRSPSAAPGR